MAFLNFRFSPQQALSIVEDSIKYAVNITNNLLYETDLNSPFRLLVEAQSFVYNEFLRRLDSVDNAIVLKFLEILGFTPKVSRAANVRLRFELDVNAVDNVYIRQGFPVRATNGFIFTTDATLLIPIGTKIGFVGATAIRTGLSGNVSPETVTLPLQTINIGFKVSNPNEGRNGLDGESMLDTQLRLAAFIRSNGLLNESDYRAFISDRIPGAIVSVSSLEPNTIDVWASLENGANLTGNQFITLQSELESNKIMGLGSVKLNSLEIINVYVQVSGSVKLPNTAPAIAQTIRDSLFSYLRPANDRQTDLSVAGLILINELERVISGSDINYIQSVKIGLDELTAYGQNFVFDPISQRIKIVMLDVILIRGSFQEGFRFEV